MRAASRGVVLAAIVGILAAAAPAASAQHEGDGGHGGHEESGEKKKGRIGVLIADHGEPPVYNADTYYSFRAFIAHLMEMGVIPSFLGGIDTGTILQDPDCYACPAAQSTAPFINAWVQSESGPGVWSAGFGEDAPAHRFIPGTGKGQGEPDIFEHGGLSTWNEWRLMGGTSPNYAQKLAKKKIAIRELRERFGKRITVTVGYGIDPKVSQAQDVHSATHRLLDRGVKKIVVVYHGVGFSDLMQTHMIRHEIEHAVAMHGAAVPISYSGQMGLTKPYRRSVVKKALAELKRVPRKAPVAIHLSGHGIPTANCGTYACGQDAYHANSLALFERTARHLRKAIKRRGKTGVFRLYGDGATDADDPGELVDSPIEALEKRQAEGFTHVIDIPYEFDSDSRDTLIVLRKGYERPIPDWDSNYNSVFSFGSMEVKITKASFGKRLKAEALERVAVRAIEGP